MYHQFSLGAASAAMRQRSSFPYKPLTFEASPAKKVTSQKSGVHQHTILAGFTLSKERLALL
jgi:hypothetical protein